MSIESVIDGRTTGKKGNGCRTGMSQTGIWDCCMCRREAGKSQGFCPISGHNHDLEIGSCARNKSCQRPFRELLKPVLG
jgi:hypothetical protein